MAPIKTAFLPRTSSYNREEDTLKYLDPNDRPCRRYGVITINGETVFYYLHFTLQEILDAIAVGETRLYGRSDSITES
jgi:hypothetical protein